MPISKQQQVRENFLVELYRALLAAKSPEIVIDKPSYPRRVKFAHDKVTVTYDVGIPNSLPTYSINVAITPIRAECTQADEAPTPIPLAGTLRYMEELTESFRALEHVHRGKGRKR